MTKFEKLFLKYTNPLLFIMCVALIFSLWVSIVETSEVREELSITKAQLETIEPELPTGNMFALDEITIINIDIFCADWNDLRKGDL